MEILNIENEGLFGVCVLYSVRESYSSYLLDLQRDIPTLSLDAAHSDLGYGSDACSV